MKNSDCKDLKPGDELMLTAQRRRELNRLNPVVLVRSVYDQYPRRKVWIFDAMGNAYNPSDFSGLAKKANKKSYEH